MTIQVDMLQKYSDVFTEKLYNYCKARPVLYAIRAQVETELETSESEDY